MVLKGFSVLIFISLFLGCVESSINDNSLGEDIFVSHYTDLPDGLSFYDTTYVPIYSDIYNSTRNSKLNLTATLSLRNTSLRDTLYVIHVDYYDSNGEKEREFLEQAVILYPMQTIEYVIEESDNSGGTGANFVIVWAASNENVKPLFQGVMIGTQSQHGLSFVTEGFSISEFGNTSNLRDTFKFDTLIIE